jgi:branched-chain amino acid transport system substrate-binding protein
MPPTRFPPVRWLAALGLAMLCGCQPSAPIKVAFVGPLSGHVSELSIDGRNGVQLAIETLNAQPGRRYELNVHDDGGAPGLASSAVDAVADEGDAFAVGPMTSTMAASMAPEAEKRHLVLISPTANSDALSGLDDWFFRVIPPSGPGADQLAEAVVARGLMSVSVMAEWRNRTFSESFTNRFDARLRKLGGTLMQRVRYESDQSPDYAKIAAQLLSTHPKLVLLVCGAVDASIVAQQLRRLDADVQIAMTSWAANVQLLQLGGRAVEGALVLQTLDLDSQEPAYVDFRKRFVQRFGSLPSQAAVYAYDAAMLGAEGLRRKTDGQSLRDVLRVPASWPGLQHPISLDRFGDSISAYHLSEVRQGRFAMLAS